MFEILGSIETEIKNQNNATIIKIPAGVAFQFSSTGVATQEKTAPAGPTNVTPTEKITPASFAAFLLKTNTDLSPEEFHEGLRLADTKGLDLIKFVSKVHGVLYHQIHSLKKRARANKTDKA